MRMIRHALIFALAFTWTVTPSLGRPLATPISRRRRAPSTAGVWCHRRLLKHIPRGGEIQYPTCVEELDTLLQNANDKLVVLYFCASDCEKVTSLYQELSQKDEFSAAVHFVQIDGNSAALAAKYQVTQWPTFLFIKQGTVLTEMVGQSVAEATLDDWIKLFIVSSNKRTNEERNQGSDDCDNDE